MEPIQTHASHAPSWLNFIPLLLMMTVVEVMMYLLARRKGKDFLPYCILGLIPLVNFVTVILLASKTDAAVLKELAELRARVEGLNFNPQTGSVPPIIQ